MTLSASSGEGAYLQALKQSLLEGLVLLEGVVTQPVGLTYDLRAARSAFMASLGKETDEVTESAGEEPIGGRPLRRPRPTISLEQALESLDITQRSLGLLLALNAVQRSWAERTERVLARVNHRLGAELRHESATKVRGLYVILDPQAARGRDLAQIAEAVLNGGARVLQLRDKASEKGIQLPLARRLTELCVQHDALLLVNDHPDLAVSAGAHGLHVGQRDLPATEARQLLAPQQLLGTSNATVEEAMASQQQGVDYLAIGAMFSSPSKENTRPAGLATLRKVRDQAQVPLVAIGGINEGNVDDVVAAGADALAVISAVVGADDPGQAAARLSERIERALARRGPVLAR